MLGLTDGLGMGSYVGHFGKHCKHYDEAALLEDVELHIFAFPLYWDV